MFSFLKREEKKHQYDLVIVGGGIVGMATAQEMIIRHPNLKLAVVEKENELGMRFIMIMYNLMKFVLINY